MTTFDERLATMSPAEAWQGFVGAQTPQEFWDTSREQGAQNVEWAVINYVNDMPNLSSDWRNLTDSQQGVIMFLLTGYLRESLA